ncbi:hypothetical protein PIB30_086406 [Stylosanthes scabra]|uniref:Putative plant transposon protein domain-containing protein n=1 Tax=Stylosanthes scabra TaxID=79078 RepID=A0ABU6USM5_9FABA|nr:hypothetical protein [Stylosanthes scabra]
MAGLLRKRKGKTVATTSEAPRFKTLYHESHFNNFFAAREVLPESRIKIDDDALSPISAQINQKKWQRLTKPFLTVASYHDRKANNNLRLDQVLVCLCVEGAQWVRHPDGRPHFLRSTDLQPIARGWYEFVCRSIMPTRNRSEVNVEWVVLIHAIIIGEDIQVDEIIAEQMYKFINKPTPDPSCPSQVLLHYFAKKQR